MILIFTQTSSKIIFKKINNLISEKISNCLEWIGMEVMWYSKPN